METEGTPTPPAVEPIDPEVAASIDEDNAEVEWEPPRPWMKAFLTALALTGNVSAACRQVGISDESVRVWRKRDEGYAKAHVRALARAAELLEEQARVWATVGVPVRIVKTKRLPDGGVETTETVTSHRSPTLLGTLLRATNPEKFEPKVRVTGADGVGPVKHEATVTLVDEVAAEARAELDRIAS